MKRLSLALALLTSLILLINPAQAAVLLSLGVPTQSAPDIFHQTGSAPTLQNQVIAMTHTALRRASANVELSEHGFAISINHGQPSVIIKDDPQTQWVHVFIGTAAWGTEHMGWYSKANAQCNGVTCEIHLDAHPTNGDYVAYLQYHTGIGFLNDDPDYWAGPVNFSLYIDAPFAPANPNALMSGSSPTLSWSASARATWYQVWLGTLNPLATHYSGWFNARAMGCGEAPATCTVTLPANLPYGGAYDWYVQGWGPGGYSTDGDVDGWMAGTTISLGQVFQGFGLGGQVDGFDHPHMMRSAGMTWAKKQIRYSQGQSPASFQWIIDKAEYENFHLLLSVVGEKHELAANPEQYIADFALFLSGLAAMMDNTSAIEVWNETNLEREWPSQWLNGAAYTEMLRAAYHGIKRGNPNVLVISAAPAPTGVSLGGMVTPDDQYIRQMAAAGAGNVLDCVGVHYNEGIVPPNATTGDPRGDHYTRYFPQMMQLYASAFPGKPLCFTELGYLSPEGMGSLPDSFAWANHITIAQQAQWLAEVTAISRNHPSIRLLIIWNVDFTRFDYDPMAGFAIVRPDGGCPACEAISAVMR